MFRGATRVVFRSTREILRDSKRKAGSRRSINMLMREEGALGGRQHSAFGRANSDTIAKALSVAVAGLPGRKVVDGLNLVLDDLIEEDDDGR